MSGKTEYGELHPAICHQEVAMGNSAHDEIEQIRAALPKAPRSFSRRWHQKHVCRRAYRETETLRRKPHLNFTGQGKPIRRLTHIFRIPADRASFGTSHTHLRSVILTMTPVTKRGDGRFHWINGNGGSAPPVCPGFSPGPVRRCGFHRRGLPPRVQWTHPCGGNA